MEYRSRIYVAGHTGLVGSALVRALKREGYRDIITQSLTELDLRNANAVDVFFQTYQPEYVFLAAAKVGGIQANIDFPAEFIHDNLAIQLSVIHSAYKHGVKKLLFLGSSCIYPRNCPQPIKEEYLLSGLLEQSNDAYAIAKIAGIKMCQAYNKQYGTRFIACMPTNLYGPHDTFDLQTSHVLPALIAKCMQAHNNNEPYVNVWGTGTPRREFLYVDDLADACLFLIKHYDGDQIINIGTGHDVTINELAQSIRAAVGYTGDFIFDATRPDGTPRKILDVSIIKALGWQPQVSLQEGIVQTVHWYAAHYGQGIND